MVFQQYFSQSEWILVIFSRYTNRYFTPGMDNLRSDIGCLHSAMQTSGMALCYNSKHSIRSLFDFRDICQYTLASMVLSKLDAWPRSLWLAHQRVEWFITKCLVTDV